MRPVDVRVGPGLLHGWQLRRERDAWVTRRSRPRHRESRRRDGAAMTRGA